MLSENDIGIIAGLLKASEERMETRFAAIEERMNSIEERMEARFTAIEERMEARFTAIEERMEARFTAIEERINSVENRLEGMIKASEERTAHLIAAEIGASHTATQAAIENATQQVLRLTSEALEATENRLLTAFHQWASPLEIRVRAHSMAIGAFDGEKQNSIEQARKIAELERRIAKLEKAS